MQFYYGDQNYLRILDEMEFWKRQESEHTVVIREIVPNLEKQYVTQLQEYELILNQTEQKAVQLVETVVRSQGHLSQPMIQHIMEVISYAMEQSKQFVQFLNQMIANSEAVKSSLVAKVVINHIIRESEYYIGISQAILARN